MFLMSGSWQQLVVIVKLAGTNCLSTLDCGFVILVVDEYYSKRNQMKTYCHCCEIIQFILFSH